MTSLSQGIKNADNRIDYQQKSAQGGNATGGEGVKHWKGNVLIVRGLAFGSMILFSFILPCFVEKCFVSAL